MKKIFMTAAAIVVLSLAVWVFFYIYSVRLNYHETMVVVGICAIIVFAVVRMAGFFRKGGKGDNRKV